MFTGIVEEVGRVARTERAPDATAGSLADAARVWIDCSVVVADAAIGASIAVDGCCVTVTELSPTGFAADLMAETLRATALGRLAAGDPVNLERPLALGGRLGGHLVQGHVDAVGEVVARDEHPGTVVLTIAAPEAVLRYVVAKGSVTVHGVSLTVLDVDAAHLRVALIPHTLEITTLGSVRVGSAVNLEVDVVAKYVERLVAAGVPTPYSAAAEARSPSEGVGATMTGSAR